MESFAVQQEKRTRTRAPALRASAVQALTRILRIYTDLFERTGENQGKNTLQHDIHANTLRA